MSPQSGTTRRLFASDCAGSQDYQLRKNTGVVLSAISLLHTDRAGRVLM